MSRSNPTGNVSFSDAGPPHRPGRDEQPPRVPDKNSSSKSLVPMESNSSTAGLTGTLGYDDGYVDVGANNSQGFSASNGADVRRKKSMVKPERERIDPGHRLWHYREHAAEDGMHVLPSCE